MKLHYVFLLVALIVILECALTRGDKTKKDGKKTRPPADRKIEGKKRGKLRARALEARKKGGMVRFLKKIDGKEDESSAVTAYIKRICEVDKDGKEVGKKGGRGHCFKKFQDVTCDITLASDVKIQGINATTFAVNCSLNNSSATVLVEVYMFEEDGEIENGDETMTVQEGAVKINLVVENWMFCGLGQEEDSCDKDGGGKEEGSSVDVDMHVGAEEEEDEQGNKKKGPKPRKAGKAKGKDDKNGKKRVDKYEVGNGAHGAFPKEYKQDGVFKGMEGDFPKVTDEGFGFRFRKFNRILFYDPIVDYDAGTTDGAASIFAMFTLLITSLMLSVVFVF